MTRIRSSPDAYNLPVVVLLELSSNATDQVPGKSCYPGPGCIVVGKVDPVFCGIIPAGFSGLGSVSRRFARRGERSIRLLPIASPGRPASGACTCRFDNASRPREK